MVKGRPIGLWLQDLGFAELLLICDIACSRLDIVDAKGGEEFFHDGHDGKDAFLLMRCFLQFLHQGAVGAVVDVGDLPRVFDAGEDDGDVALFG